MALLSPKNRRLLLSLADEHNAFRSAECLEMLLHDVILALSFLEEDDRDLVLDRKPVQRGDEAPAHRRHQGR